MKNNRTPLLYYVKLYLSFQSHWRIQTWVTVRKHSIRVKIGHFLSRVTFKFDGWPWKTIGHLLNAIPSFVHHFKAIGKIKLELQSGNAQFRSKLAIFCLVWPWNLMDDLQKQQGTSSMPHQALCIISKPLLNSNLSYSPETLTSGQNQWFFLSRVTLKFNEWPWKTKGHFFYAPSSFVHHFITISVFELELQSGNTRFGSKSTIFLSHVTLKFDGWPWKTIGHLFYIMLSFTYHFKAIG